MRAIDADELKKCVLKWLPQDPCGKEEKEMPFETDICVSMLMEIDEQPTIQPEIIRCRNCKFASGDSRICMKFGHSPIGELDFCSFAERREVTT